jgi:excisionase family DNA binding protein
MGTPASIVTVAAAADQLGIGIGTLYRWLDEGRLPSIKYGERNGDGARGPPGRSRRAD